MPGRRWTSPRPTRGLQRALRLQRRHLGGMAGPGGRPLLFVTEADDVREELVRQLIRIGYDNLVGYLEGGMEAWSRAKLPYSSLKTLSIPELHRQHEAGQAPMLVDVRFNH